MLSDLDIGMNDWVTPKIKWDDSYRPNRGLVLTADQLESIRAFTAICRKKARQFRRARCPASIRTGHFSRAVLATTSTAATPKFLTNIRK